MLGDSLLSEDWEKVDTSSEWSDKSATMTSEERGKAALHEENQRLLQQVLRQMHTPLGPVCQRYDHSTLRARLPWSWNPG